MSRKVASVGETSNDPRRPPLIKNFILYPPNPLDEIQDYMSFLSLAFVFTGLIFKNKMFLWQSIVCCFISLANMKTRNLDLKQVLGALFISVVGLIMEYKFENFQR
eukprot:TRINITY_DN2299_c0_g1_i1.p1 TRINITY_DN2299_c0_g1~~TRINITY_DN2299_c0_g1_i1.p1  ORF type:complete len:106 (-),score=19.32 TRINITY_DN2299_c0_g1_i1:92-409(-)